MYSVLLATMLTAGAEVPNWGHHCHGCYCSGYCYGCGGCHHCHGGWGCSGCYCSGCYCSGCYCSGCYCSGYAFSGCYCSGCYCSGCYCSGYIVSGCYCSGCYCSGCYCSGCYYSGGYAPVVSGVVAAPVVVQAPAVVQAPPAVASALPAINGSPALTPLNETEKAAIQELLQRLRASKQDSRANAASPAHLTVVLPKSARLYVDNVLCPLNSEKRSFDTPKLQPGQRYYYTLRMEAPGENGGPTQTQSQRVIVAAGQQVTVNFGNNSQVADAGR